MSAATDGPALETPEEIERRVMWLAVRIIDAPTVSVRLATA